MGLVAVLAAAGAAAAACSSTATRPPAAPPAASASSAGPSSPAAQASPRAASSPQATSSSLPANKPAAGLGAGVTGGRCHSSALAVTDDGGQGAGGMFYGRVVLRNISRGPCTLYGYPGLQRLDSGYGPEPTRVIRAGRPPTRVVLAPTMRASFAYRYSNNPPAGQSCADYSTASYVQITPPDETASITARSKMHPCTPGGPIEVSAVRPGTAGPVASQF